MENKLVKRVLSGVVGVLFVIGIIITFMVISNGSLPDPGTPGRLDFETRAWNGVFKPAVDKEASAKGVDYAALTDSDADKAKKADVDQAALAALSQEYGLETTDYTVVKSAVVDKAVSDKEDAINSSANSIVNFAYWLAFITTIVLVLFGVVLPTIKNPKSMIKSFWLFAGALGVFLLVIWFSSKGKEMPADSDQNLVETYKRMKDSKEVALMGLKGKAAKNDNKKYKIDLFKEYLESKDVDEAKINELAAKYVEEQREANEASIPVQKQADWGMSSWAITTTLILTFVTLAVWILGSVYSMVKK